jgi:iron complex outermembrane receptor protein
MKSLNWSARMAGFYTDITDWIIWKPGAYQYWTADNLQHVITRGFEGHLHLDATLNLFDLSFSGNYTCTRATSESRASRIPAPSGRQLVYLPIHAGNATVTASCKGYFVNWICEYTGKRLTQTGEEITNYEIILNPFLINDIITGKNIRLMNHEFILQLAIMNLFNREYQMVYSRPMPGRNYSLKIGYKF